MKPKLNDYSMKEILLPGDNPIVGDKRRTDIIINRKVENLKENNKWKTKDPIHRIEIECNDRIDNPKYKHYHEIKDEIYRKQRIKNGLNELPTDVFINEHKSTNTKLRSELNKERHDNNLIELQQYPHPPIVSWGGADHGDLLHHLKFTPETIEKNEKQYCRSKMLFQRKMKEYDYCNKKMNDFVSRPYPTNYEDLDEPWYKNNYSNNNNNNEQYDRINLITYRKNNNNVIENDPTRGYIRKIKKKDISLNDRITSTFIPEYKNMKDVTIRRFTDEYFKYHNDEIDPERLSSIDGMERVTKPKDLEPLYSSFTNDNVFRVDEEMSKNNPFEIVFLFYYSGQNLLEQ